MMRTTREVLSGTPDNVSARLEELSRDLALHEYMAGTKLRMLAVELTKRPNLKGIAGDLQGRVTRHR